MVWYLLYDLVLIGAFILFLPVLIYKMIFKGKYRVGLKERLGYLPKSLHYLRDEDLIWIHAVSVGETVAASSVVTEIKERFPEHKILFSTVTDTGQEMAHKIVEEADEIIYFPLDFSWVIKRVLRLLKPDLIVITETELWPNLIRYAKELGSKVMLVNGRISDDSAKKYKYLGPIMKDMLDNIDFLSMQSEQDVDYITDLGADKEKVINNGNTKFDQTYAEPDSEAEERIYDEFKIDSDQPILVVGSTHPNEEEQLIPVYKELKAEFEDLVMILAPRHIKRVDEIEDLYQEAGIDLVRRTEIETRNPKEESVILLNTIGELAQIYGIADLVFIGGSLIKKGGHNILEPAAHGKLVFFGPHMFNFKESTSLVLEHEVGIQVSDVEELKEKMLYYLSNEDELEAKSRQALEMIESNKGASVRNAKLAERLVGEMRRKGV
ncbi:MAG: 3-deoxy-D-manno-octulosonic-acid transferase [Candidatus Frackibacter sp. T328-2]|nr:MAG: 3-deoxy-D-manno-octulosonic-acid transferase [Candidatus Frackibacter sp. T328-2]